MAEYTRLFDILYYQQEKFPNDDCLAEKVNGQWKKYSTQDCIDMVNKISRAFAKYGLKKDDKVVIVSGNRPQWNFIDLGMLQLGIVNVPVYPTISEAEYKFIFNDAKVKMVFAENKELFEKVKNLPQHVESLEQIYTFDEVEGATNWSEFLKLGEDESLQAEVDQMKASVQPGDLATIIYTSGTTGTPKGVMLSHNNVVSNVRATIGILPIESSHKALSFLPLCHIFERMVIYCYYAAGASIYYAESMETIGDDLKDVKPQFFTSVPRLLEKVYDKIVAKGLELTGVKRKLFFWALDLGLQYDERGKNGAWYNFKLGIARKLIFSKWKEALGGNIIGIVTGAAALQKRLELVFNAAGILVRQGYGQTETSPVLTLGRFDEGDYVLGTVGYAIEGVELKLADNGEICAKGPNIMMGYYGRPDLTAQTIDEDGWLHTGDVGEFVDGKYLKITDRVKELFKTSGGKYVAPQVIENKMKESVLIEQMMVLGENEKFVSALIVPNPENLLDWAKSHGITETDINALVKLPEVKEAYREEIDKYNENFSHIEQVKKFTLLPKQWGVDSGELTPTMKIKRKVIMDMYKAEVADIYNV